MSGVQEVPLKVEIARRGEVVETRRRRLVNPSYEVVTKVADEVARGKHLLQYVDEDGDMVTMSSQGEWEECMSCWDGVQPLKIRIELCSDSCENARKSRCTSTDVPQCGNNEQHATEDPAMNEDFAVLLALKGCKGKGWKGMHEEGGKCGKGWKGKHREGKGWKGMHEEGGKGCKGMHEEGCKGWKGMHEEGGKGCKGMHEEGGKGWKGMHGKGCHEKGGKGWKGMHDGEKGCKDMFGCGNDIAALCGLYYQHDEPHGSCNDPIPAVADEAEVQTESTHTNPEPEHPSRWMKGCKGSAKGGKKGMHGKGGKGCKGREPVDTELIGQKCSKCDFQMTGIVDGYCCKRCSYGKGHGKRCERLPFADFELDKDTESTLSVAVSYVAGQPVEPMAGVPV